jgi:hypothetical protein
VLGRTWPALCDELIAHYVSVLAATGSVECTAAAA